MDLSEINRHPHIRFNPLLREWVQVSPHRSDRPWEGQVDPQPAESIPRFDPACYLCPGNRRAGGQSNPKYEKTFVFDNDFPALLPASPDLHSGDSNLLIARVERGICRVVCFSPMHDLTFSKMEISGIRAVIEAWVEQYRTLGAQPSINYVLIFENRGAMMGASNPHPHCQIWATATTPNGPAKEELSLVDYRHKHGVCMLCAYLEKEKSLNDRLVCENSEFAVIVPFWAVWPFETIVISKRHVGALDEMHERGLDAFASILKSVTTLYDDIFHTSFPYSMGLHQRPTDGKPHDECHLHAHFYPPLLRSATVRKFMVGFEMFGTPQRDITPELAARRLREAGEDRSI